MVSDKLNSGVLMLGSLLWDNTKGRKAWREHYFGENFYPNIIDVKVPIRYGRFSQIRGCPTMVLSSEYWKEEKYGTAKFVPFKNQEFQFSELICAARDLSSAEGSSSREFIKGGTTKWCILTCWLNYNMENKESFVDKWSERYFPTLTNELIESFKMNSEDESLINERGCLKMDWPELLTTYDVVLATQTKPRKSECCHCNYLKPNELAEQIFSKPEYFIKNRLNGITTFDDDLIIEVLKSKDLSIFRKNAKKDGCIKSKVDTFIQSFLI
ncbi:MAG TPA: hypothetical protein VFM80_12570 [Gracilimonas sp.]|uniref:hypothetical protein n=1 Tax=Gracilimonas sp. TaxID=1974203 RepID=UPI002DB354F2|nr:hypothetical protein [Gracilimonas sp.]